jgi:transcriptional regulator with XRE-family HTH domain
MPLVRKARDVTAWDIDRDALRRWRLAKHLSQRELAKRARLPWQTIAHAERVGRMRVSTLLALANALEVRPTAFFRPKAS